MSIPADDDRRLSEASAEIYLGFKRGTLRRRRERDQPPLPSEVDANGNGYYRLGDLRRYSRGDATVTPTPGPADAA
jgi:hypothetical protein